MEPSYRLEFAGEQIVNEGLPLSSHSTPLPCCCLVTCVALSRSSIFTLLLNRALRLHLPAGAGIDRLTSFIFTIEVDVFQ